MPNLLKMLIGELDRTTEIKLAWFKSLKISEFPDKAGFPS